MVDAEMERCPFNATHIIIKHRMPYHIVKCQKSYVGEKLIMCHFNAKHWVPPSKMLEHLEECKEYLDVTMEHQKKRVDKITKELIEKRSVMSKTRSSISRSTVVNSAGEY